MNIFRFLNKNINIYILIITITFSQCSLNRGFRDAKYINDFKEYEEYKATFSINKLKNGFLLIYSPYCPHCINFAPNYITLSQIYHGNLFFYATSKDHGKFQRDFSFRGFPTILFYNNGTFTEYHRQRSVAKLSKYIRNSVHQLNCTEISYNRIKTVIDDVYKEDERNIIIGFFKEEKTIKSFTEITYSLTYGYIDLCYYVRKNESITDFNYKKFLDMKENEIWTNSKIKGENNFIFNEGNYQENLFEKVINIYEDINKDEDVKLFEKMKNRDFIVFAYNKDDIKTEYINKINKLFDDNKQNIFLEYYFILYNKNTDPKKLSDIENNKIYHISNDFQSKEIIEDLNNFLHILNKNTNKLSEKENKNDEANIISSNNIIPRYENLLNKDNNENIKIENNIANNITNENKLVENIDSQKINDIKVEIKTEDIAINKSKDNIKNESSNSENKLIPIIVTGINNMDKVKLIDKEVKKIRKEEISFYDKKNNEIKTTQIKRERKETLPLSKPKIDINPKEFSHSNFKNKTLKTRKFDSQIKYKNLINKMNDKSEQNSNSLIKLLIILAIIAISIYFLVTKYLCVGFIKVNDNQIIEFNNQSNKIEIV